MSLWISDSAYYLIKHFKSLDEFWCGKNVLKHCEENLIFSSYLLTELYRKLIFIFMKFLPNKEELLPKIWKYDTYKLNSFYFKILPPEM
jgi:hypothetical protein